MMAYDFTKWQNTTNVTLDDIPHEDKVQIVESYLARSRQSPHLNELERLCVDEWMLWVMGELFDKYENESQNQ